MPTTVNRLVGVTNYCYDPAPGYNEAVPMTDLTKYPSAKPAVFTTGNPTLALSGGTWLSGAQWGRWDGAFLAAVLKGASVRVLTISGADTLTRVESPPELVGGYGRLRTPQLGPDRALYLMTLQWRGKRPDPAADADGLAGRHPLCGQSRGPGQPGGRPDDG